jgi:hypothetical protein
MTVKIPDAHDVQLTHIWFKRLTKGDTGVDDLPNKWSRSPLPR